MIKNIKGTVLAVAVAFGAGTNLSHTPPQTNTKKIVKASGTTTLSDHYSKVRFSRSSDIKTISKTYQLKVSTNYDFSNISAISGEDATLKSA